jgi:hypothetical protein
MRVERCKSHPPPGLIGTREQVAVILNVLVTNAARALRKIARKLIAWPMAATCTQSWTPQTPPGWPGSASGGGLAPPFPRPSPRGSQPLLRDGAHDPGGGLDQRHHDLRMLFRDSHPMRQRVLEVIDRASL